MYTPVKSWILKKSKNWNGAFFFDNYGFNIVPNKHSKLILHIHTRLILARMNMKWWNLFIYFTKSMCHLRKGAEFKDDWGFNYLHNTDD